MNLIGDFSTPSGARVILAEMPSDAAHAEVRQLGTTLVERCANRPIKLHRTERGKPISDFGHVSLSHTGSAAAAIFHTTHAVGIDVELLHRDARWAATRFSTSTELAQVELCFSQNAPLLVWTCKECLFKWCGLIGVHFKTQLELNRIETSAGEIISYWQVKHPEFLNQQSDLVEVSSRIFGPYLLSTIG